MTVDQYTRMSERAGKKAGEALISLSTDPRVSNSALSHYLVGQVLPDQQRRDLALVLVMGLLVLAKPFDSNVIDENVYNMIGPYYREHL